MVTIYFFKKFNHFDTYFAFAFVGVQNKKVANFFIGGST